MEFYNNIFIIFFERLEFDLGKEYRTCFYDSDERKPYVIDNFILFDDKIWAVNGNGKDHYEMVCRYGAYWSYAGGEYGIKLTELEKYEVTEISELNEDSYQIYLFLLMILRVATLNINKERWDGVKAISSLDILCGKKLINYDLYERTFVEDISLLEVVDKLNKNNPARFYLDDLTKYWKTHIDNCHTDFSVSCSSFIVFDLLSEYISKNHKVNLCHIKEQREKDSDRDDSYNLVKNDYIEVSDCSCQAKSLFGTWKYNVSVCLFMVGGLLHITYVTTSGRFDGDTVLEARKDNNMKKNFQLICQKGNALIVEKIMCEPNWEFCMVYDELVKSTNCLIEFLKNDVIYAEEEENYNYTERWSSRDLADYYGYQGEGSVDDFLDNL